MNTARISGKARIAGVMGWPVAHSRSPRLHNYWLARYGIDGAYVPLAVRPENLESAVRGLPALGFAGANLTIPHKEAVLPFLDEIDPAAARMGAVNTIVVRDGRLSGRNTDGFGFLENLKAGAPSWRAALGPAVVIGAGGAAKAIAWALIDAGVPHLRVVNRTMERAQTLAAVLGPAATAVSWDERAAALADAALVVNASALGMTGQPPLELDLSALPQSAVVNDIVYVPLETALLTAARARGHLVVDGIGMLLHQGRPGFQAWYGIDPAVDDDLRAHVLASL
ncbi:MAG: shikimate dehydrogenase [Alphaproteobacteria bacterium]